MEFWDAREQDWVDEWTQTNQLPKLVMVSLKLADNAYSSKAQEEITRIVSLPAMAVAPVWQVPRGFPGAPGAPPPGGPGNPGGQPPPVRGTITR